MAENCSDSIIPQQALRPQLMMMMFLMPIFTDLKVIPYPILINHINNGDQFALIWSERDAGNAPNLHKAFERLN